jgi:hypothetical protein
MSIAYPITLPTSPGFQSVQFRTRQRVGITHDPFGATQNVYAWPGQWIEADVSLPVMTRAEACEWVAALVSLNGIEGTFHLVNPTGQANRGSMPGTPLVNGANAARSRVLLTKGWTSGQTNILRKMDLITVGSGTSKRMYMNLKDVNSDGSGNATLDIFPSLREALADGAAITTANCSGTFRLSANNTSWDINEAMLYGIQFSCVEAI